MSKIIEINKIEKRQHITRTKHNVLLKKIDNLYYYASKKNITITQDMLNLLHFVKNHSYNEINRDISRKIERYTSSHYHKHKYFYDYSIIEKAYELIEYSKNLNFELCQYFFDDLEKIKNDFSHNDINLWKPFIKNYISRVWRENDLSKVKLNGFYIARTTVRKKREIKYTTLVKRHNQVVQRGLSGRFELVFNRLMNSEISVIEIAKKLKNNSLFQNDNEVINKILFENISDDMLKIFLYQGGYRIIRSIIVEEIKKQLQDITKHDKEIDASQLSQKEVFQSFNNSISKFMELYYQQPREYKPILKNYDVSVVDNEITVIQSMLQNSDDIKNLKKLFRIYKEDTQGLIYNYSLFSFIYFCFALKISSEYIYNSQILKSLNLYKIERDRNKPTIKKNAIATLKTQQIIYQELDDNESVFIDSLIKFLKEYIPKKYNYYSIAYLTNELQNSLTASKSFIESFEDKSYKKLTKKMLPKVINTILPPVEKIICI